MLILLGFNIFPCTEEDILYVRKCFKVTCRRGASGSQQALILTAFLQLHSHSFSAYTHDGLCTRKIWTKSRTRILQSQASAWEKLSADSQML